jgi:hypothetical protein
MLSLNGHLTVARQILYHHQWDLYLLVVSKNICFVRVLGSSIGDIKGGKSMTHSTKPGSWSSDTSSSELKDGIKRARLQRLSLQRV